MIKSNSTASMSFPLSTMSFLTTLSWTVYGFLISDVYVEVSVPVGSPSLHHPHTASLTCAAPIISLGLGYEDVSIT